jgi:uncharacterized protein YcnI
MRKSMLTALALIAAGSTAAYAHITLETQQATVGTAYKAVLRVPHGCNGSATVTIHVQVPEGMFAVKPMPKPGWKLETVKGKYAKEYDNYGTKLTEGVKEVIWSGGNLPDEWYDEFVLRGSLAPDLDTKVKLYFPVVQECEKGADRWIEIPEAGKTSDDYETPAPGLTLMPKP